MTAVYIIIALLFIVLLIAFIIGLVKPSLVLRWDKNPTRLKVFLYAIGFYFLIGFFAILIPDSERNANNISLAESYIEKGDYNQANRILNTIDPTDTLYNKAQSLIMYSDSMQELLKIEEAKAVENKRLMEKSKSEKEKIKKIEAQINKIDNELDLSIYEGSLTALSYEIDLFEDWGVLINEAKSTDNKELITVAKKLEKKVSELQSIEYPKLRKKYSDILKKRLWVDDITVTATGTKYKYLNFSGGIFAANRNKQQFQQELNKELWRFRFKQSRYRWYEGQDEYTYYTIFEGNDREIASKTGK